MYPRELSLAEELMLLALRDDDGTVFGGTMYTFAIGGAVVAELALAGRITVDERQKVHVVDSTRTHHPLVDDWLGTMAESKKVRPLSEWVRRVAGTRDLRHRLAVQLVRRGILRASEDKVLLVFTRTIYPELDPRPEAELMERIERAIFEDDEVEARTAILVSLAYRGLVLRALFGKKRLAARKTRLEALADRSIAAGATEQAVQAMHTAMMVSAIVPTIAATTVVTS